MQKPVKAVACCPGVNRNVSLQVEVICIEGGCPDELETLPWIMPQDPEGNDSWGNGTISIEAVGGASGYVLHWEEDGAEQTVTLQYRCSPDFKATVLGVGLGNPEGCLYDITVVVVPATTGS